MRKPEGKYLIFAAMALAVLALIFGVQYFDRNSNPSNVVVEDIESGTGPGAGPGDLLTVEFETIVRSTGQVISSTKTDGYPFQFYLGQEQVLKGWDIGLLGVKSMGIRKLILPADFAYGAQGVNKKVPPGAVLESVIKVLSLSKMQGQSEEK